MPEQKERSRPQGDPLEDVIANNPEENRAQRDSDAPSDASVESGDDRFNNSDRSEGRGSDANGIPAFDDADGTGRKRRYDDGADLVSRMD